MPARLGFFRYHFEQRSKERLPLLSHLKGPHWSDLDADAESRGRIERMRDGIAWIWAKARASMAEGLDLARSDFRKVIFAAKMGIALSLVSLLIFLKEPSSDLSTHSVWVILTVVAVFEFSIGSTLSKGLNQGLGTLSAGGLALGAAELLTLTGQWDELVTIICIFITGFWATFLRLYPSMKPYEYGFRVFLLTFCFILISGLRTHDYVHMAVSRFLLIVLGAAVGFGVNICFFPIWAGEDLHSLVVKNFMGVAKSLEGCVNGYLNCVEYERVPSKILTYQASDDPLYNGYRTAVGATAQEDSLMSFAIWEPPHGPYKMLRYPWKSYVKVSGALRHCALMVTALHGCVLSEIQAPPERRQVFRSELQRVGTEGARVLRELGGKVKTMTKLSSSDILLSVHEAAEDLQKKIDRRSYLLVDADLWEIGRRPYQQDPEADGISIDTAQTAPDWESVHLSKSWDAHKAGLYPSQQMRPSPTIPPQAAPKDLDSRTYESASALSLATFASLLIEFVARLQNLVDAFEELSDKAKFKECSFGLDEPTAYSSPGLCSRAKRLIMGGF